MTLAPPSPVHASRAGRVALVGRPNAGKSTLFNALLGESLAITSPHPQTTRETVRGVLTREDAQFVLLDTPGMHAPRSKLGAHMNAAARAAARDADALVWVIEPPARGAALDEADAAIALELPTRGVIVAINKIDRVEDRSALLPLMASIAGARDFDAIVPISARRRDGLGPLLDRVRERLPVQPLLFDPETVSDQPIRFFVAEFVREQILRQTRQEVPHGAAVVVERFDEGGPIPHIDVAVHVARESHKKILIGAAGQMAKSIGTAARARVERMLGRKVHLRLRVKATPGWMDDEARLRELGYGKEGPS